MKLKDYYSKEPDEIYYKRGDRVYPIFYIDPPTYIIEEVFDTMVKTQCGKKLFKYGIRPIGYYNRWAAWSKSIKTL